MSTRGRRARGRPPKTPLSSNRTNFLRKPKAYQNQDVNTTGSGTPSPVSHFKSSARSDRFRGRAAAHKSRHFVSQLIADDDEIASLTEENDRASDITDLDNTDVYEASEDSLADESDEDSSDNESLSTVSSVSRRRLLPKRPKTPELPEGKDVPELKLPTSATDLLLPAEHVLQAVGIYEVLRHFRIILRLSPFTFEDFCASLLSDEQSNLQAEIHITLMKALLREEDSTNTTFGPHDLKDSVNVSLFFMDSMTWPDIVRAYLDSEKHPEYRRPLSILESPDYPFVPYTEKLQVLQTLTDLFLAVSKAREEIVNEGNIQYDDHCRACHKLGDLLCCETCSAVYHLACVEPPMEEVPEDDWLCSVCRAHQVKGVTDCVSEAEKSGLMCRQEPIGYDRHARKYWFLCRRIIVESENETLYYSTKIQLEELLETLEPEWEGELISFLQEMKDDIIKQMGYTEDLTNSAKGHRKSILDIENAQLVKIQAERAQKKAKEEEERKAREEEEEKKKKEEEEKRKNEEDNEGQSGKDDILEDDHGDRQKEESMDQSKGEEDTSDEKNITGSKIVTTEVVETTTTTTTTTTTKSTTISTLTDGEPPLKQAKLDHTDDSTEATGEKSSGAELIKASGDGKAKVINLDSLLPGARKSLLNMVDKSSDKADTKTVLLVNREGGKVTLQVQRQPVTKEESVSHTTTTSSTATTVESRKMTTRSKTGSLTPKLFTDSITMTTSSLKSSSKNTEETLVMTKDGEVTRVSRGKISVTSNSFQMSSYFKLGAECSFKHYQNQYTTNNLALNKHQHNEERDKRRHLSHKFSLTASSEFKWNGVVTGNRVATLATLRLTITNLESNLQAPFLHNNWSSHRQNWQKAVQMCQSPRDFALALLILEACIKPCVFNPVWHEALGHLRLSRITVSDREEWKKKEKEQRRRREDEDEGGLRPLVWIKYTMGLKHQVWKQKGEEYRVTGGNGWQWVSATRNVQEQPQDSVGLRLVAQRLKQRKVRSAKTAMKDVDQDAEDNKEDVKEEETQVKEEMDETEPVDKTQEPLKEEEDKSDKEMVEKEKSEEKNQREEEEMEVDQQKNEEEKENRDCEDAVIELKPMTVRERRRQSATDHFLGLMREKYVEDKDNVLALEVLKQHPAKVDVDLINVSEAIQKRTYYPKVSKPNSKLDNLLERRMKQDEIERKQRLTVETQIALKQKLTQAIETAQKRKDAMDKQAQLKNDQLVNGEVSSASPPSQAKCYSLTCRRGEGPANCYSPLCRRSEKASALKKSPLSAAIAEQGSATTDEAKDESSDEKVERLTETGQSLEKKADGTVGKGSLEDLDESSKEKAESSGQKDESVDTTTEDEEVDIEGDPVKGEASPEKKAPSKGSSVSDIVKNLVIKTMAEKAVASGKGNPLAAQTITNAVANVTMEELEARLPPKRHTADKFKLAKLKILNVSKEVKPAKNGRLPKCHKFETCAKKKSVLILDRNELSKIARQGAKRESIMFNYNCKMNNVCWPYPCPRPLFKTAWRYRTMTLQSLSAAALQLRILWACIRWDDMAARPPAGGTNTVSTETEITTTELLKRREVGVDGLRSEFLVRKIVVPLGVTAKPKEKYTPQRSGLRERKRAEAVRQTEPSVTEVWVPEEVLELWEIKQFGEKLERQRQALQEKAEKAAAAVSVQTTTTVTSQQSPAQIKAQMEQQLKQQRQALAQKRLQETQGTKSPSVTNTSLNTSGTTIIINSSSQLGKPGATFKTLTVSSANSLLTQGILKAGQSKTIIANASSLLGSPLRPGIRVQIPSSSLQLKPQTVTLAPKPGTTTVATSGSTTITRLITPGTTGTVRLATPGTTQGTQSKAQTIQIKPASSTQPVQSLQFVQTPGGQLQVRGLLPGQIIHRMSDGKFQILTMSTSSSAVTSTPSNVSTPSSTSTQLTSTIRPTLSIQPQQTIMVTLPSSGSTSTITQNRLVLPAQLASSKQIIMTRPGGSAQVLSGSTLASVLGSGSALLANTTSTSSSASSVSAVSMAQPALNTAVVISAPSVLGTSGTAVVVSQPSPCTVESISTKPVVTTSLLAGQVLSGTSLLQRATGTTSLLNLNQSVGSGGTLTISSGAVPKLLASPPSGGSPQIIQGSTPPQIILRASTPGGPAKVITAQQLRGLTGTPHIQLKPVASGATVVGSPIKSILSPQTSPSSTAGVQPAKTVTAIRSLTPQLVSGLVTTGQQPLMPKTSSSTLLPSPEAGSATSPSAGAAKYAITPQVVEQVVRQALLQNQTPEIQSKLLAMQKQIQQQQQPTTTTTTTAPSVLTLTSVTTTTPSRQRTTSQGPGVTSSTSRSVSGLKGGSGTISSVGDQSRSKGKGLTMEQKEEQSRASVCGQVMKTILDRIEREEKQEQRNKKKQESVEEKQKRVTLMNQHKALHKHKEALKKEIHKKRSLMEKNLQQEIYTEMAESLKKTKLSTSLPKSPPAGAAAVTAAVAAPSAVIPVSLVASGKTPKKQPALVETPKAPHTGPESKASIARKRKQKLISTGLKGLNPREKLYCVCKTPYDDSKFYIGCDLCSNWFHGSCVHISEAEAQHIDSYICEDCRKQQENTSEELYCICRTPYDENQFYVGCDRCQDWFHGHCVGLSKTEADKIEVYVCPNCQKEESADPIAQKTLSQSEYQELTRLLRDLQSHKMSWPFLNPVDPREVPDYYDIVSEPMDFTIVEAKLTAKAYKKLNDFMKDVTKIFDNCRLYNPVGTPYFQCAEVVETYFAQKVKALRSANKL